MASSKNMAVNLDELTETQLSERLGELGMEVTGSRAVLRERLRKALNFDAMSEAEGRIRAHGGGARNVQGDAHSHKMDAQPWKEADGAEFVHTMKKKELQKMLSKLGLPTTGLKADLRRRLEAAWREDPIQDGEDESDDDDEEEDEVAVNDGQTAGRAHDDAESMMSMERYRDGTRRRTVMDPPRGNMGYQRREHERTVAVQSTLSFKDVEDALETFSGDGTQNIRRWFVSFEETADLCRWSETQRIVYLKKLLRGSAKLFANYECHARSWEGLKRALIDEFGPTMNCRQVHKELSAVTKKAGETYQEYVYRVLELASHSEMGLESKIQYIIDGIKEDEVYKSVLYGANTIKELRQRLVQFEAQQANRSKAKQVTLHKERYRETADRSNKEARNSERADKSGKKCYNCGDSNHLGRDCPHKSKGAKCYACGEFGHMAARCTKNPATAAESLAVTRVDALQAPNDKKTYKTVSISGKDVVAIIDSGSDLHLIRSSCYVQLGAPRIRQEITRFGGVGSAEQSTLGRFTTEVQLDGLTLALDIDVVPDNCTGHDLILGGELSELAEVRIHRRTATLARISDDAVGTGVKESKSEDAGRLEVLCIEVSPDVEAKREGPIDEEKTTRKTLEEIEEVTETEVMQEEKESEKTLEAPKMIEMKTNETLKEEELPMKTTEDEVIGAIKERRLLEEIEKTIEAIKINPARVMKENIKAEYEMRMTEQVNKEDGKEKLKKSVEIARDIQERHKKEAVSMPESTGAQGRFNSGKGRKQSTLKTRTEKNLRYSRRREAVYYYGEGNLVVTRSLRPHSKYYGPYRVNKAIHRDRYMVQKIGNHNVPSPNGDYKGLYEAWDRRRLRRRKRRRRSIEDDASISGRPSVGVGTKSLVLVPDVLGDGRRVALE